jgi:hypothetical protein
MRERSIGDPGEKLIAFHHLDPWVLRCCAYAISTEESVLQLVADGIEPVGVDLGKDALAALGEMGRTVIRRDQDADQRL